MAVEIRMAETAEQLRALFELRARVFVGEGVLAHGSVDALFDEFDALPTTANFIVLAGDRVIGGCRGTLASPVGFPADDYYDFRPHLPDRGRTAASGSMLCVDPQHRDGALGISMVQMIMYWMRTRGVTHGCAPVRPEATPILSRMGWSQVGDEFEHPVEGVPVVPMIVDLVDAPDRFARFVDEAGAHGLVEDFRRRIYQDGDRILAAGEPSDQVFVVVSGAAQVTRDHVSIGRLEAGEVFGEVGVLLDRPRTADVTADGRTELMVLERGAFEAQLLKDPKGLLRLLRAMSERLAESDSHARDCPRCC